MSLRDAPAFSSFDNLQFRDVNGAAIIARIGWRTVPLLGVLYVVSFLDRVNIGFAALSMNRQLGISAGTYGWAAGVFFIGYLLFQVPSNIMLDRFGPRRWMALILLIWGLVSMAMAMVYDGTSLIAARFFLGLAEAGFFPGVILYLTRWFPVAWRARIIATFMFAIPVANIIGAPISGFILKTMDGLHGLANWQWLFIVESLPAILGAAAILLLLPDRPQTATWLSQAERDWLLDSIAVNQSEKIQATSPLKAAFSIQVLLLALGYFGLTVGLYGVGLWLPQIVAQSGTTPLVTGMLSAIPYLFGAVGMLLWSSVVDRDGARVSHVVLPGLLCGISLAISTLFNSLPLEMLFLTLTTIGITTGLSSFWAYSTRILPMAGAAVAIAVVNSMGNLGGFIGPVLIGWIKDATQSFQAGLLSIAAVTLVAIVLMLPTRTAKKH